MALPKGVSGNPNGRPKGVPNKSTQACKDVIAEVANKLGGASGMYKWATKNDENERSFWEKIYPRLAPLQVSGDPQNPLKTVIELTFKSSV